MTRRKTSLEQDTEFRRSLYAATKLLGWLVPQSEAEVAAIERDVDPRDRCSLAEAMEVLDRDETISRRPIVESKIESEYDQEFRRAARLGSGKIPVEVENRMNRDREESEQSDDGE